MTSLTVQDWSYRANGHPDRQTNTQTDTTENNTTLTVRVITMPLTGDNRYIRPLAAKHSVS